MLCESERKVSHDGLCVIFWAVQRAGIIELIALVHHITRRWGMRCSTPTSLEVQFSFLTSFPSLSHARTFSTVASSSFSFFISRLCPPLLVCFFKFSRAFSTNSISLIRSSSLIMSRSRTGLTSPSTWIISASSKQRTTWKIASTALIWERKALPSPAPVDAPRVKPAIS